MLHYYYYFPFARFVEFFSLTMPSKMTFLFGVPMVVGGCAILWIYWDRLKKPPKKKIFICADCWLCVFDLLSPRQLGLGIALISHRFDVYVDEHFKTRKWTLKFIEIRRKIEEYAAANEMEITNYRGTPMPIPQKALPKKVVGFRAISIEYIDQNVIAFLQRFPPLFASAPINLNIYTTNDRISEFILHKIWPMLGQNIHGIEMVATSFHHLRQNVPSILNECPSLRFVKFYANANFFSEFPADENAAASDGQAMAKWLCTPFQNNVPKVLRCLLNRKDWNLTSRLQAFRAAFANASSPVNFIVVIYFHWSFVNPIVVPPFDRMTNELTGEQLAFKSTNDYRCFVLVRCPIERDESKWTKWEKEAIGWHICDPLSHIGIHISGEDDIGEGLLDGIPGPNNQQK